MVESIQVFLFCTSQQQYQSFPPISLCYVIFGRLHERTGFVNGMYFIWSIVVDVVRCDRFGDLVIIVLLFMGGWRLSSGLVCCGRM